MMIEGPKLAWGNGGWSIGYAPSSGELIFLKDGKPVTVVDLDEFMSALIAAGAPLTARPAGRA